MQNQLDACQSKNHIPADQYSSARFGEVVGQLRAKVDAQRRNLQQPTVLSKGVGDRDQAFGHSLRRAWSIFYAGFEVHPLDASCLTGGFTLHYNNC
jgi:hypothetical protein